MRRRRKERLGGGRGDEKGEKLDGRKNESNKAKTKKFFILFFDGCQGYKLYATILAGIAKQ